MPIAKKEIPNDASSLIDRFLNEPIKGAIVKLKTTARTDEITAKIMRLPYQGFYFFLLSTSSLFKTPSQVVNLIPF